VTTLRTLVLAVSVLALLPLGAMAASQDPAGSTETHSTASTHHKKPVHPVSHKTHTHKHTPTSTQS
jgi:hypothetical protein